MFSKYFILPQLTAGGPAHCNFDGRLTSGLYERALTPARRLSREPGEACRRFGQLDQSCAHHAPGMELRRLLFLTIVAPAPGLRARRVRV